MHDVLDDAVHDGTLLGVDFWVRFLGTNYYFDILKPNRGRFEFFAYFPKLVSMQ